MIPKSTKQILQSNSIIIIGAGASGLLASIILSRAGFKVKVFDKNKKIGRKILATGNGRCNISNQNILSSHFNFNSHSFIKYALKEFDYLKFEQFFQNIGLEFTVNKNKRVYPITLQASSVVDLLNYEALKLGVEFILNTEVNKVIFDKKKFLVYFDDKKQISDKVIIATGGLAYPRLGSCDAGHKFARIFGHNIIEPFASLVQLCSNNDSIYNLSGVKINAKATLEINGQSYKSITSDILFTNYGLSGDAILDISRDASYFLSVQNDVTVVLDIFPHITKDILISKIIKRVKNSNGKDKYFWLEGFVNKKLIRYIIDNCGINNTIKQALQFNKKDILNLVYFMKNMKVTINSTKGFETAEVSAGGVDLSQIESKTMQSKLQKGLYFTGEVVDVDGDCGGYNLHWAWASGYVCANSIINTNSTHF
ncbi:NAD(FAD)-utilizing dehydrogenases [hydrothermal vent metagenome]|uniref:NAD(FAD)-utilizing dehydrogenases n=1 Tax=hydrothermal vent metagenome TaxID=652676 RepID=A0A3B1DY47_9ZZZZ